jgi:hypothetical protein
MRTTLTLDDDVAALLERARKRHTMGLKPAVNEALRRGLTEMLAPRTSGGGVRYQTPSTDLGRCLTGGVDDISEVLVAAEGEAHR